MSNTKTNIDFLFTDEKKWVKTKYRTILTQTSSKRKILYALHQAIIFSQHFKKEGVDLEEDEAIDLANKLGLIYEDKNQKQIIGRQSGFIISKEAPFISTSILSKFSGITNNTVHNHLESFLGFSYNEKPIIEKPREKVNFVSQKPLGNKKYNTLTKEGEDLCTILFQNKTYEETFKLQDKIEGITKNFNKNEKVNIILREFKQRCDRIKLIIVEFLKSFQIINNQVINKVIKKIETDVRNRLNKKDVPQKLNIKERVSLFEKSISQKYSKQEEEMIYYLFKGSKKALEYLFEKYKEFYFKYIDLQQKKTDIKKQITQLNKEIRTLMTAENEKMMNIITSVIDEPRKIEGIISVFEEIITKEIIELEKAGNKKEYWDNIIAIEGGTELVRQNIRK